MIAKRILGLLIACFGFARVGSGAPVLTPTLDAPLQGSNSVIYCPTFQVCWDKLAYDIVGEPIHMNNETPLVDALNTNRCPDGVLPDDACVAMAGYVSDGVVGKIQAELKKKFGNLAPEVPAAFTNKDAVIISYCYLQRKLPFPLKFMLWTDSPLHFATPYGTTDVQYFGTTGNAADYYGSQVSILNYKDPDTFTLRLSSRNTNEFIVLAKMKEPNSLAEAVATASKHVTAEQKSIEQPVVDGVKMWYMNELSHGDVLAVPVIDLSAATNITELCGSNRNFTNKRFEGVWISDAYQDVKFRMDESGAAVQSTAYGAAAGGGSSGPRRFIFDKPFLLALWKSGAELPYLAVWVKSDDIMVPVRKQGTKR